MRKVAYYSIIPDQFFGTGGREGSDRESAGDSIIFLIILGDSGGQEWES